MKTNQSDKNLAKFHADHAIYSFACELTHRYPETGPYFELYEKLQKELDERVLPAALSSEIPLKLYAVASRLKSNELFGSEALHVGVYSLEEGRSIGDAIIAENVWDGLHDIMQAHVEVGQPLNIGRALETLSKACSRAVVFSVPLGVLREGTFIAPKKVKIEKQNVRVNITQEFLAPYFRSLASPEVKEFVDRILQSPEDFQEAA